MLVTRVEVSGHRRKPLISLYGLLSEGDSRAQGDCFLAGGFASAVVRRGE